MPETRPYRLADQTIANLNKHTIRRFMAARQNLIKSGFDELNVLKKIDALYAGLQKDCRDAFSELWMERYLDVWKQYASKHRKPPDEDELDDLLEVHLARLLDEPHPVTRYTYNTEITRKRDRAKESVTAAPTQQDKRYELDKAMRYVAQQNKWYADFTSQDAEVEAFIDMGAEAVQRHELDDTRTCAECREADGAVFPVGKIPPLPHPGCRRWFTPVYEGLAISDEDVIIETVGRSLGAKAKNYRVLNPKTGEYTELVEGTHITQPKNHVIAGKGRDRKIDVIDWLMEKYPGESPENWTKEKGFGFVLDDYGEARKVELHWFQCPKYGKVELKIKPQYGDDLFLD